MKAVIQDGRTFRVRRGKLVEVPPQWVGQVTHDQTKRKRTSRKTKYQRTEQRHVGKSGFFVQGIDWKSRHPDDE